MNFILCLALSTPSDVVCIDQDLRLLVRCPLDLLLLLLLNVLGRDVDVIRYLERCRLLKRIML
jgi:hypothetical protein